jgi:gluconolactonase
VKTARHFFLWTVLAGMASQWAISGQTGPVERLQPELDGLISANAKLERVGTQPNFKWTEGPVWVPAGFLLFAEIPSNGIYKWTPDGHITVFMQPSGYTGTAPYNGPEPGSNGMTLDARGRLTVAGHARRSVWRLETMDQGGKGPITVLAESYQGKRLNSPNDLVYKSDGSLYFTDPPYGLRTQSDNDPEKQLKVNGVYRIKGALQHPAGAPPEPKDLQLLTGDLARPNGIAFSPDEKYLYVNNSEPLKIWMRYPVKADGTLGPGTVFHDATADTAIGGPDGMKVDVRGNIYSTGPGGVWIFSPEGKHLGTIRTPERAGNLAFGDADYKTLYITASAGIYRIHVQVPGISPLSKSR